MMRKTLFVVGVALAVSCMAGINTMAEVEMGVQADQVDEGEELYRQAEQGSSKAMMSIGLLYMNGDGVETDYQEALKWMLASAEAGDRKAPRYVGMIYEKGLGVAVDYHKATDYYQMGAERRDITSQYYLGKMYEYGQGVQTDYGKALEWYQKAAERGDKTAAVGMIGIASLHEYGRGVSSNEEQAAAWYQKAAETGYPVENGEPQQVTAITDVFGNGQKITAVVLEYSHDIQSRSVAIDSFSVEGRVVTKAYANSTDCRAETGTDGKYVVLELSATDQEASVYEGGIENGGNGPTGTTGSGVIKSVFANVKQEKSILSTEDIPLLANHVSYPSTRNVDQVVDRFQQKSFRDPDTGEILMYNLYVPEAYDPEKEYPLVLFMADASADGDDVMITLRQGNGATVWAAPEEQEKHPSFVLAPQFSKNASIDINDTVIKLIRYLESEYRIDARRIYTSGQSAGCIRSIDMDIRYPGFFAGLLLVAGQSDADAMGVMKDENIWIIVSEGDKRGFPAEELPNEHNSSMHFAYDIEGVRDWLFEQVLGEQHP